MIPNPLSPLIILLCRTFDVTWQWRILVSNIIRFFPECFCLQQSSVLQCLYCSAANSSLHIWNGTSYNVLHGFSTTHKYAVVIPHCSGMLITGGVWVSRDYPMLPLKRSRYCSNNTTVFKVNFDYISNARFLQIQLEFFCVSLSLSLTQVLQITRIFLISVVICGQNTLCSALQLFLYCSLMIYFTKKTLWQNGHFWTVFGGGSWSWLQ